MYRRAGLAFLVSLGASFGLAFLHPAGDLRAAPKGGEIAAIGGLPDAVKGILETKCADCHSNRTHWPIYSRFAPVSWLVDRDVRAGRAAMNLSLWGAMTTDERISALTRITAETRAGGMPPSTYAFMHPDKRITPQDQQALIAWARAERKHIRANNDEKKDQQ